MDEIKEYIKVCIKQNNFRLTPEKIRIISSYGTHKLYYNSDFICYINPDDFVIGNNIRENALKIINYINKYNELLKKKIIYCILCITTDEYDIIKYIISILEKLSLLKILLVAQNNTYYDLATQSNLDYIIAHKNDYKSMVQCGINTIKTSLITGNMIMVTNTNTIIDTTILSQTFKKFNSPFNLCGPSNCKYLDRTTKIVNMYNIVSNENVFLSNWFIINKALLVKLNWNMFDGITDICNIIEKQINGSVKVLKISNVSCICFEYERNKNIIQTKANIMEIVEHKILSTLLKELPYHKYESIYIFLDSIQLKSDNIIKDIPEVTIDNRKKTVPQIRTLQTKTIAKQDNPTQPLIKSTKLNINRYYLINNFISRNELNTKIKSLLMMKQLNYVIIEGNKNRILAHIAAIKDAITRNMNKIAIIEDIIVNSEIVNILMNESVFPLNWDITLINPSNPNRRILKLNNNDRSVNSIAYFGYCIKDNMYKKYLQMLNDKKNIYDAIFNIQQTNNVYIYSDFIMDTSLIYQPIKEISDIPKTTIKFVGNQASIESHTISRNYTNPNIIKSKIRYNQLVRDYNHPTYLKLDQKYLLGDVISKNDSNRIVQGLWIGEELSLNEILCITSFIHNSHEFHLYVYGNVKNIPSECIIKDANEIIPESEIFYYSEAQSISGKKRPTAFSNMFRYKLLYDKGGYWVDMDMICIKYLRFNDQYVFSSESTFSRSQTVNAGIIKCPPKSDFAKYCYEVCKNKDKSTLKWGEIGPKLVCEAIEKYKLQGYVKPWNYFCPIGYDRLNELITPTKIRIDMDWYCIHLWNEIWVKNNLDKNKIYYGSLFGILVNKYCKKYVTHEIFNLEFEYGKYNKSCVLFYWMPRDEDMVNEMENFLNMNKNDLYDAAKYHVHKEYASADKNRIKTFINSDIYVYMFTKLLELGIIDNLHIIFGMARNDKYVYNNEPLFSNGNYYNYNDKIFLWKLNDIKSLFSFTNAKMYFYKGYGNYEHFYSQLNIISPQSIYIRYLATALPYTVDKASNIVIDDKWIETYAHNDKCKKTIKNFANYFSDHFTKYDLVYVDTIEKIPNYKKIFFNTKKFLKMDKYSVMNYDDTSIREFDLVFCASDVHPSKNWDIFYDFLTYCERMRKNFSLLIITPVIVENILLKYTKFRHIKTTVKRGLNSIEMNQCYNKCKCLLITFGRDANPRVMSESLSCGCYNIVLDILSDGKDVIKDNPILGKIIKIPQKQREYEFSYRSIKCSLTSDQYNKIYNLIKQDYDHSLISRTFTEKYNYDLITNKLYNFIKETEIVKNRLIVTLATEDYSNNMNYLLASIKHTNPSLMVLVYYIGWRDTILSEFKKNYPNYDFEEIKLANYIKGDIIKLKVKIQRDVYFKFKLPFIWIDADSVVLKDLSVLFNKIGDNNLICYHRPYAEFYMKFAVGVISFGLSENNKMQQINEEFIEKYYQNSMTTTGYNNWFYDQSGLYETYQQYENDFKLYELSEDEHSINDTKDTLIYSRRLINKTTLKSMLQENKISIPHINFTGIKMKYD
jgi:hypothetical protein